MDARLRIVSNRLPGSIPRLTYLPASTSVQQLRAKFPITPVVDDYYFEVHILKRPKACEIGFVDAMFHYVIDGFELYSSILGQTLRSWCYAAGHIFPEDELLSEPALAFTTNDIVGCHFDRVRGGVSFTLNGKRACKPSFIILLTLIVLMNTGRPLPGIRGKLRPMIRLQPGARVRTNFGSEPFVHEVPEPAAPEAYVRGPPGIWPLTLSFMHPYE